jgi:translation initiation factor 3 subunit E
MRSAGKAHRQRRGKGRGVEGKLGRLHTHYFYYCFDILQAKLVASRNWNLAHLSQVDSAITEEVVDAYRQLARFRFDCGDYATAREMLANYVALFASPPAERDENDDYDAHHDQHNNNSGDSGKPFLYYLKSVDSIEMLQVLWGRLACDILVQDWEAATIAMDVVKNGLEAMASSNQLSALQALQQRTWLLHWSLFVFWNHKPDRLVDFVFSEKYKQAVTTLVPHLLRYLTAAVLLCKRRLAQTAPEARKLLKNLVYLMQEADYSDPVCEFVKALVIDYDFESAQIKLAECESVLATDFFLKNQSALFMEEARVFVFENYCRIHNKIDLQTIATRLGMDSATAEKWIVDLIRKASMDAVIDGDCVVMGDQTPSTIYEYVMDKSRDWNVRSATLVQNLHNVVDEARKEKAKRQQQEREDD